MPPQSLLGHLATRFTSHPENLATEALAYILKHSPAGKGALLSFVGQLGLKVPSTIVFRSQASGPDGGIPDLVGSDMDGKQVVILEAKFWAGLTDKQPVGYLDYLPKGEPGALIFIAPALRLTILWSELLSRSRAAQLDLGPEQRVASELQYRTVGERHVLALASWRVLIDHLIHALNAAGDQVAVSDLLQLQGLCERMDDDAFLPLRSEELTSNVPRFTQFCHLIDDVASQLVSEGIATVEGLRASGSAGAYYRPMKLSGFGCYLQVNAEHWARRRSTPIWISVQDGNWQLNEHVRQALRRWELEDPPRVLEVENALLVPLNLPLGVERPAIVEALLSRVRELAELLRAAQSSPTL